MEYRMADVRDAERFTQVRMEFVQSIRTIASVKEFAARTRTYLQEHLGGEELTVFLAVEGEEIAASCMACIYETAPLPSCTSGKSAELLNVYTRDAYRRQGHAEALLRLLLEESKQRGVEKMVLEYTEAGLPLYRKLGFEVLERQMVLKV